MKKVLMNWSGGKDSSLCLYYLQQSPEYEVVGLLTLINDEYDRVPMHGIRTSLIERQAEELDIPLQKIQFPGEITMEEYDQLMLETLRPFKEEGVTHCAFGDIFLEDLRARREEKLQKIDLKGFFPLWKRSTEKLAHEFIDAGFEAILTSVDGSKLDSSFVGRPFDNELLDDLPPKVDPCGEYGAFHSFVHGGPIFQQSFSVGSGDVVERTYKTNDSSSSSSIWFIDLRLSGN